MGLSADYSSHALAENPRNTGDEETCTAAHQGFRVKGPPQYFKLGVKGFGGLGRYLRWCRIPSIGSPLASEQVPHYMRLYNVGIFTRGIYRGFLKGYIAVTLGIYRSL